MFSYLLENLFHESRYPLRVYLTARLVVVVICIFRLFLWIKKSWALSLLSPWQKCDKKVARVEKTHTKTKWEIGTISRYRPKTILSWALIKANSCCCFCCWHYAIAFTAYWLQRFSVATTNSDTWKTVWKT